MKANTLKLLFIVNPGSGHGEIDYVSAIDTFFKRRKAEHEIFTLPDKCDEKELQSVIRQAAADRIIAVGGDGTLKLVASCMLELKLKTPLGILPAGSANGMAKEMDIPVDVDVALKLALNGKVRDIHVVKVNGEICIHLSDIGFNAYLVKKFDELPDRGMKTYAKAAWHAFWNHRKMEVSFKVGDQQIRSKAAMVVIANATKYGTGFLINPDGKLDDKLFEIILIKEYAVLEILKIWLSKLPWNPKKIEAYQVDELQIKTRHKAHFQIDGEYRGKVDTVTAKLLPSALSMIMP